MNPPTSVPLAIKHLSFEASKTLEEIRIPIPCGLWYVHNPNQKKPKTKLYTDNQITTMEKTSLRFYRAPTLHELFLILPKIGETLGWKPELQNSYAFHITNLILQGGTMNREVSTYLINIVKDKKEPVLKPDTPSYWGKWH